MKLIDIVLFSFCSLALLGCPDNKSSEDIGPASGGTGDPAVGGETAAPDPEPVRPEAMPMLCTLDGGKWCGGACMQAEAGPLCCAAVCVPYEADVLVCDGSIAWCNNYSISDATDPKTALKIAICHDEP